MPSRSYPVAHNLLKFLGFALLLPGWSGVQQVIDFIGKPACSLRCYIPLRGDIYIPSPVGDRDRGFLLAPLAGAKPHEVGLLEDAG